MAKETGHDLLEGLRLRMKNKKILIVDFDRESLNALTALFHEDGLQVITARDGLTGLEKFRQEHPDLVILEAMLPKINGFELCRKITSDSIGKTPVVILTGVYREVSYKIEALQIYGATAFFTKPWDKTEFRSKIYQYLGVEEGRSPSVSPEPKSDLENLLQKGKEGWGPKEEPLEEATRESTAIDKQLDKQVEEAFTEMEFIERKKEKKEKKVEIPQEVDAMLKNTLAGLGLRDEKKKPAVKAESVKLQETLKPAETHKPPVDRKFEERIAREVEKLIEKKVEVKAEKKPEPVFEKRKEIVEKREERKEEKEERALAKPETPSKVPFGEFIEKKKKPSPLLIGGLAAGLILVGVTFVFLFQSKKSPVPPQDSFPPALSESGEASQGLNERLNSQVLPTDPTKVEKKKQQENAQDAATQEENAEVVQPVVPAEAPALKLEQQAAAKSETTEGAKANPEAASANKENPPSQEQKPAEQPAQATPATAGAQIKQGDLLPLAEVDVPPRVIRRVEPRYPPLARQMGLEGNVSINALISENGDVLRTEIIRGIKGASSLEDAAETAILQWKFSPAQKNGVAVKVWRAIEISFKKGT